MTRFRGKASEASISVTKVREGYLNLSSFTIKVERYMEQMFNRYLELSKSSYEYCEGIPLYPSEIHAVEYIAYNSETNLSDLANAMSLTKGAISKMVVKLEKMGLIKRFKYLENQKDVYLHLTKLGMEANEGHKKYHKNMYEALDRYFESVSEEHKQVILDYLNKYLTELNKLRKPDLEGTSQSNNEEGIFDEEN
ncbi:MAG: MarR family transcriptional regulator [Acetivibrionales bacterium]